MSEDDREGSAFSRPENVGSFQFNRPEEFTVDLEDIFGREIPPHGLRVPKSGRLYDDDPEGGTQQGGEFTPSMSSERVGRENNQGITRSLIRINDGKIPDHRGFEISRKLLRGKGLSSPAARRKKSQGDSEKYFFYLGFHAFVILWADQGYLCSIAEI